MRRVEAATIAAACYVAFVLQAGGALYGLPATATASLLIAATIGFALYASPLAAMWGALGCGMLDDGLASGPPGVATASATAGRPGRCQLRRPIGRPVPGRPA